MCVYSVHNVNKLSAYLCACSFLHNYWQPSWMFFLASNTFVFLNHIGLCIVSLNHPVTSVLSSAVFFLAQISSGVGVWGLREQWEELDSICFGNTNIIVIMEGTVHGHTVLFIFYYSKNSQIWDYMLQTSISHLYRAAHSPHSSAIPMEAPAFLCGLYMFSHTCACFLCRHYIVDRYVCLPILWFSKL